MAELDLTAATRAGVLGGESNGGPKREGTDSKGGGEGKGTSSRRRPDALRADLRKAVEGIAEWRESRGDDELGAVLREDALTIARTLAGAARRFPPVRAALLLLVAVVEPALAFGRVGRILFGRFKDRRDELLEDRALAEAEAAAAAAEAEAAGMVPAVPVG